MKNKAAPSSMEVLENIQASLERHLAQTPPLAEVKVPTGGPSLAQPFEALEVNLARIEDSLARASRGADEADAILNAEIEELRRKREALAINRKRLI